MNLNDFVNELNTVIEENKNMKDKIALIKDKINFIFKEAEKEEEFSRTHLMMCGIAKQLQDILEN
jgi:archaellum component FlaC